MKKGEKKTMKRQVSLVAIVDELSSTQRALYYFISWAWLIYKSQSEVDTLLINNHYPWKVINDGNSELINKSLLFRLKLVIFNRVN